MQNLYNRLLSSAFTLVGNASLRFGQYLTNKASTINGAGGPGPRST